jgi:hypothetical protein
LVLSGKRSKYNFRLWFFGLSDAADRRDALAAIPGSQNKRLAARRPGVADRRSQHETGFIKKNQVIIAGLSFTDNARKLTSLAVQNGGFIAEVFSKVVF